MARSSGLNPPQFPTNTTVSLADDPYWTKPRQIGRPHKPETIARREARNADIRQSDLPPKALASKYHLSPDTVRRIKARK